MVHIRYELVEEIVGYSVGPGQCGQECWQRLVIAITVIYQFIFSGLFFPRGFLLASRPLVDARAYVFVFGYFWSLKFHKNACYLVPHLEIS